ncbi:hypothetical protein D3C86_1802380 [compost metagenome]
MIAADQRIFDCNECIGNRLPRSCIEVAHRSVDINSFNERYGSCDELGNVVLIFEHKETFTQQTLPLREHKVVVVVAGFIGMDMKNEVRAAGFVQ